MPVPNVPSVVRAGFEFTIAAGPSLLPASNVLHIQHRDLSAWSDVQIINDLGLVLAGWATDHYLPQLSDDAVLVSINMQPYRGPGSDVFIRPVALPGTQPGAVAPPQVTFAIKHTTPISSRRRRGRTYVPGIALGDTENVSQLSLLRANGLVAAFDDLLADLNAMAPQSALIIFSRVGNFQSIVNANSFTDRRLDTQRRRVSPPD